MTGGQSGEATGDEWPYDAFRVGRATRTVEVDGPNGGHTIEEGTLRFEPINEEDTWMWEEEEWISHFVQPGADGLEGMVHLPHEKVGILEFPRPMTDEEADEWLTEKDERWRQFCDESVESDVTAADVLEEVR